MIIQILKPEMKKFILPAILLFLFVFLLNEFYHIGYQGDQYFCDFGYYMNAVEMMKESGFCTVNGSPQAQGNIQIEQQTQERLDQALTGVVSLTENWRMGIGNIITSVMIMIDPFFPAPCEMYNTPFCEYYISKTSFECSRSSADSISTESIKVNIPDYRSASIITVAINAVVLIIEGYLISCILLLPWSLRNVKIEQSAHQIKKPKPSKKFKSTRR